MLSWNLERADDAHDQMIFLSLSRPLSRPLSLSLSLSLLSLLSLKNVFLKNEILDLLLSSGVLSSLPRSLVCSYTSLM